MSKLAIGIFLGLLIGAGCRYFDVPVPSPPKLAGALLVVAMALGYTLVDTYLAKDTATTAKLCGGPTGKTVTQNDR